MSSLLAGIFWRGSLPSALHGADGLRPYSAGWAQEVTNLATDNAKLPLDRRVQITEEVPAELPFWGFIIDGIRAVAEERCDGRPDERAEEWMKNVDVSLADLGVEVHPGKRVDRRPGEEFQGAMIHPTLHWLRRYQLHEASGSDGCNLFGAWARTSACEGS